MDTPHAGTAGSGPRRPDLDALLTTARRAAAAGAAVLAGRDEDRMEARNKSSASDWVTAYDTDAERAVRAVLAAERPDDIVSGEEFGTSGAAGDAASPDADAGEPAEASRTTAATGVGGPVPALRWSIDPLDGTTNFIRGIVYYGTSVAVVDEDGRWLAGVVNAPALGREYWAAAGAGAWRRSSVETPDVEQLRRLSGPDPDRSGKLIATGFAYNGVSRTRQLGELGGMMSGFADLRRLGAAALDLCLVADGTLDAYRESGLHEHDWAAGALIAEEAGCWVHRPTEAVARIDPSSQYREEGITAAASIRDARALGFFLELSDGGA
ncbi:inositol monophosphatase [Tersicoccus solisilvae]|uniref:Inositol monophosphatase n=1 Tax=Tersicoccus solisilvae TaxID=1882339 RepID=A0ABQ1PH89_9MICC|nr:inositol monophosphatase family protein [Tersicoccus solisilvae]GGC97176.1 inositol monophosphatase [Tersicoccus solisilvae]